MKKDSRPPTLFDRLFSIADLLRQSGEKIYAICKKTDCNCVRCGEKCEKKIIYFCNTCYSVVRDNMRLNRKKEKQT